MSLYSYRTSTRPSSSSGTVLCSYSWVGRGIAGVEKDEGSSRDLLPSFTRTKRRSALLLCAVVCAWCVCAEDRGNEARQSRGPGLKDPNQRRPTSALLGLGFCHTQSEYCNCLSLRMRQNIVPPALRRSHFRPPNYQTVDEFDGWCNIVPRADVRSTEYPLGRPLITRGCLQPLRTLLCVLQSCCNAATASADEIGFIQTYSTTVRSKELVSSY